jgi:anhydro-N-acetylmuramic acid kinase
MSELFVGLISGTSVDGVDAVLASFDDDSAQIVAAATTPFPPELLSRLRRIIETPQTTLRELGALDHAVGRFFASCTTNLLRSAGVDAGRVTAIGHHGQTIFHEPVGAERFTMQIGDPNIVVADTGIPTVADFRRLDMAYGGQGAPLVPAFHAWRFGATAEPRVVVNIGGIANITTIEPSQPVLGFDTGPGNTLLDLWIRRTLGRAFDDAGQFAATGRVDEALLARMLTDPYFAAPAPKSTGRELFHMEWIDRYVAATDCAAADVQATLAELTAATIVDSVKSVQPSCRRIIVCGGGAHNDDILARLRRRSGVIVETTAEHGLAADWVEATAFAWLARARLRYHAGNVPSVTGARRDAVLGGVYWTTAP